MLNVNHDRAVRSCCSGLFLLEYLLLRVDHDLAAPLLDPLLLELLASVHFTRGARLAGAHLAEPALP